MSERSIFIAALEKDDAALRAAYLDQACAGDEVLRARIERLLKAHEPADSFLERGPADLDATDNFEPSTEPPGTVIGPFKLIEPIGEGGMGSVWMAQQTEPVKRLVAVKLIKAGMDSRQVIARFEAERQALALMDHPNIARVLDGGTSSAGRPYFVMDLVKGMPITRYCDEHHLTPRQRLELFIPVCQAVQHAHQKGVIHRDLKPSNVLVALYDSKPVPKIIDFGVAKATGQQLTDKTLVTGFGAIVGTLEYMSPEQAEINQLDIDTRSDIYSLGVLLYELLAGSPPFSRKELEKAGVLEMLRVIREQEPSKPSTKLSTAEGLPTLAANRGTEPARLTRLVRGELDWIVMKALEKDRNRRYETANGFAMDVQRYLADEPVQAGPPSAAYRLRKFARRNKGALAVAALVLFFLALLGSGLGWVVRDRSARQAQSREAVKAALDKVADLRQRARWGEAKAVLEQVRQRLGPSGAEDLRRRVEQAEADLALVDRLDAARMKASVLAGNRFDTAAAAREYAAAFREAGIGEETEAAEVVAGRIRSSAVREQLVAAVDDWAIRAGKLESERRAWLLAVARAADPDPWRDRFRDPAVWQDVTALERLAREANVSELSSQIIYALNLLLAGQHADATPLLRNAQRRYPNDFWLNFSLGMELHGSKRWEDAVGYYRAAIAVRPAAGPVYSNLGLALQERGRVDEAIVEYRKAIELNPTNARAHSNLGYALSRKGSVDEAIAEHRKAIELDPELAAAHNNLGSVLRVKGRVDEAIVEYQKAIQLDPKYAAPHSSLGNALLEGKGRVDEAIAEHRKAVELDPKDALLHFNLGNSLRVKGHVDEAIAEWRKAIELGPEFTGARQNLGNALIETGRLEEAILEYRKAIQLDPKDVGAHTSLGYALHNTGRADEAIAAQRKAIELDPKFGMAHHNLGVALRAKGHLDEAIAAQRKTIELDPKHVYAHYCLGLALRDQGKLDEAIIEYRKAILLAPKFPGAHYDLGSALSAKGHLDEAIAECKKTIELAPQFAGAHTNLGIALRQKGLVDEGIIEHRKAIELDPKDAGSHHNLGNAFYQKGSSDDAIAEWKKAIELNPKFVDAHVNLGTALRGKGHVDEAIAELRKVIELAPKNADAQFELGQALKTKGDLVEAIAAFEKVIQDMPNFSSAHFAFASALAKAKQWDRSASVYAAALKRFGADHGPGPWYEAIDIDEVFTRLVAQQPDDRFPWIMRARLRTFQRDWKRAAEDYAHLYGSLASIDPAKAFPEGSDDLFSYGCVLLLQGDHQGYEQLCKKWADRVGDSSAWGSDLARTWAVNPRPIVPATQIVERAEKTPQGGRLPWNLHVLSLAHFRSGDFKQAVERAVESNAGNWGEEAKSLNWFVLAMAHSRLGHAEDARASLEQAFKLAGPPNPSQIPGVDWPHMPSQDFVEFELLRREAEELINPKAEAKPDKK
jgi:tetratricopeptide (TPR) repeat protein